MTYDLARVLRRFRLSRRTRFLRHFARIFDDYERVSAFTYGICRLLTHLMSKMSGWWSVDELKKLEVGCNVKASVGAKDFR